MRKLLGFVKADKQVRRLGGEIFHERKRRKNITFLVLGIIAFLILNLVLYSLSTF